MDGLDSSKIKKFSFSGIRTYAKITKIYDPDTFTVVLNPAYDVDGNKTNLNLDQYIKLSIRLDGIDSPELKCPNPAESNACKKINQYLSTLITNNMVVVVTLYDFDKYGRALSNIELKINGVYTNLNELLIQKKYVRQYSGGTKIPWTQQELEYIQKN